MITFYQLKYNSKLTNLQKWSADFYVALSVDEAAVQTSTCKEKMNHLKQCLIILLLNNQVIVQLWFGYLCFLCLSLYS